MGEARPELFLSFDEDEKKKAWENAEDYLPLEGLSENDRNWKICQKGWEQVYEILEGCSMEKHYEKFKPAVRCGTDFLSLNRDNLKDIIGISSEMDIETIVRKCKDVAKTITYAHFRNIYGNPFDLLQDCREGRELISATPGLARKVQLFATNMLTGSFEEKWGVPPEDEAIMDDGDHHWVTAVGCDGMLFTWPIDHESPSPPVVRCRQVHNEICSDLTTDFHRMKTITCGGDCRVVIHDVRRGSHETVIKNNDGIGPGRVFLSVDGDLSVGKVAVGAIGGVVKIADAETAKVVMVMKPHEDDVYDVKADWDLNQLVSCAWDHNVNVCDIRTAKKTRTLRGHKAVCNRLAVDFDRQLALSCAWEEKMILWDLRQGEAIKTYNGPAYLSNDVCVDWKSMTAVSGGDDGKIHIWSLETREVLKEWDCDHVQTIALDANFEKGLVFTGSWDFRMRLWDFEGRKLKEFFKPRRCITQVCIQK